MAHCASDGYNSAISAAEHDEEEEKGEQNEVFPPTKNRPRCEYEE